jgi:hypothetical protein
MYPPWLFSGPTGAGLLSTYAELGMLRGFSLLWEVMATPRYGSYALVDGGYAWMSYSEVDEADLYLPPGEGRREYSRYDVSSGYNLYQRVLESGYFYEQIGALRALTASDASVLGIGADVNADSLTYSIPYYLVFQDEIDHLFTGIVSQDFTTYGPGISDGKLVRKDLWLENLGAQPPSDAQLQIRASWSARLYTMLYGTALLSSNFDASFLQKSQIAIAGESETVEISADFEELRVTDPTSGRTYVAYRDPNADPDSYLGAKLVERVQTLVEAYDAEAPDSVEAATARSRIRAEVADLEILRSLYAAYQHVLEAN